MNTEQNTLGTLASQQGQNSGEETNNREDLNYESYRHETIEGTPFAIIQEEGKPNKMVMGIWLVAEGGSVEELKARAERKDWDLIMSVMGAILQLEEKAKEYGINLNNVKNEQ